MREAHARAIEHAYALVEIAQGQNDPGRIEAADAEAGAHGWEDVRLLLDFARSLAAREAGADDSPFVRGMVERATALGDPMLLALAHATTALRRADGRRRLNTAGPAAAPLVESAVLIDEPGGLIVHRAAAMIELATVSHMLGYWEMAAEHYETTRRELAEDDDPRWRATVRRQQLVVSYNQMELQFDWACAYAGVGDWDTAREQAAAALRAYVDVVDDDWPRHWAEDHRAHLRWMAALAGDPPPDRPDDLDLALRAAAAGADARAAALAEPLVDRLGLQVPGSAQLLCLRLAARRPGTPPMAIRYGDELAVLRWHNRLDRLAGIQEAIAVARRRRDHEQLRRQVLVDDLTGLANRRGYHTYLAETREPGGYAVMMIDVDHFKKVNDTFGHDAGDVVLARLGEILSANVRPIDLAARLGGDEFVVILADVTPDVPEARAQLIIDAVRTHPWEDVATDLSVSISVGVHHGAREELATLLTDADRHLYQAKHHGRGRVMS